MSMNDDWNEVPTTKKSKTQHSIFDEIVKEGQTLREFTLIGNVFNKRFPVTPDRHENSCKLLNLVHKLLLDECDDKSRGSRIEDLNKRLFLFLS
jgi:hypothetical protein